MNAISRIPIRRYLKRPCDRRTNICDYCPFFPAPGCENIITLLTLVQSHLSIQQSTPGTDQLHVEMRHVIISVQNVL